MNKFFLLSILLLSSCSLTPDYKKPAVQMPEKWQNANSEKQAEISLDWWKNFESEGLNETITKAQQNNKNLEASLERIEQARASAVIAGASLLPSINASASTGTNYNYALENNNSFRNTGQSSGVQMGISYEVDLFGKNKLNRDSAIKRLESTGFDHTALLLLVEADTAKAYSQLLAYNDRIKFAQQNLENAKKVMNIVEARFESGVTTALEVAQQKTTVANFESNLAGLKQQQGAVKTQLAILTGELPQGFNFEGTSLDELQLPEATNVQPSEILSRRPDIAVAEANLIMANMDIGVARAAMFPNLQLSLNGALDSLVNPDNLASSLLASSSAPIFRGGALKAAVASSEARVRELTASYHQVVLTALKEIEDTYSALETASVLVKTNRQAVENSQKAHDISLDKYKTGTIDFQPLLDAQRSLLQAQDSLLQARLDEIVNSINLYKALGGGWQMKQ
jgi:multidrug efflux system outer membrane protein